VNFLDGEQHNSAASCAPASQEWRRGGAFKTPIDAAGHRDATLETSDKATGSRRLGGEHSAFVISRSEISKRGGRDGGDRRSQH
jgi:hypothetical protein